MIQSKVISSGYYPIYLGSDMHSTLANFLSLTRYKKSRIFVLVDKNTRHKCLPLLFPGDKPLQEIFIIEIPEGEHHKNIQTCAFVWNELINKQADRHSLIINLGGGVVTDLGGFVAATFKRGIRFIHVPTTLIGQVDAAIGGKVGIDYGNIKNQIGLFANPEAVMINPDFLSTLEQEHIISGYAEILKHGLIHDAAYWRGLQDKDLKQIDDWYDIILRSIEIKSSIVKIDPVDRKYRKVLNFGHTIGHALESAALESGNELSHGRAIAAGMICEAYISYKKGILSRESLDHITQNFMLNFPKLDNIEKLSELAIPYLKNDKKNENGSLQFTLLSGIGLAIINQDADDAMIRESLDYFKEVYTA